VLFGLSIAENVRYGFPDASDEQVDAALAAAGLDEFVNDLPDGVDTVISERGASLSGGERQRVAIARALIRQSPILILDEPTTGLDPAKRHEVIAAIHALIDGTTTLLVTHDMQLAAEADEILVLERGRVAARASYPDLVANSPQFRRLAGESQPLPLAAAGQPTPSLRP
jgi:ATP-binding cassette subfamily B protein